MLQLSADMVPFSWAVSKSLRQRSGSWTMRMAMYL